MKLRMLLIGMLLGATSAWALTTTRTETRMDGVSIWLLKQPEDPAFRVSYTTYDEIGQIRSVSNVDYWPELTPSQKTQIRNIVDGVYVKLHNQQQIPLPSPTPVPTPLPSPSMATKD